MTTHRFMMTTNQCNVNPEMSLDRWVVYQWQIRHRKPHRRSKSTTICQKSDKFKVWASHTNESNATKVGLYRREKRIKVVKSRHPSIKHIGFSQSNLRCALLDTRQGKWRSSSDVKSIKNEWKVCHSSISDDYGTEEALLPAFIFIVKANNNMSN